MTRAIVILTLDETTTSADAGALAGALATLPEAVRGIGRSNAGVHLPGVVGPVGHGAGAMTWDLTISTELDVVLGDPAVTAALDSRAARGDRRHAAPRSLRHGRDPGAVREAHAAASGTRRRRARCIAPLRIRPGRDARAHRRDPQLVTRAYARHVAVDPRPLDARVGAGIRDARRPQRRLHAQPVPLDDGGRVVRRRGAAITSWNPSSRTSSTRATCRHARRDWNCVRRPCGRA